MNAPNRTRAAVSFAMSLSVACIAAQDVETAPSEQPIADAWITAKVKTELAATQGAKSLDLGVRTVDGAVTLTGVLANDLAVQKAIATTNGVKGVKNVDASGLRVNTETKPQ